MPATSVGGTDYNSDNDRHRAQEWFGQMFPKFSYVDHIKMSDIVIIIFIAHQCDGERT